VTELYVLEGEFGGSEPYVLVEEFGGTAIYGGSWRCRSGGPKRAMTNTDTKVSSLVQLAAKKGFKV